MKRLRLTLAAFLALFAAAALAAPPAPVHVTTAVALAAAADQVIIAGFEVTGYDEVGFFVDETGAVGMDQLAVEVSEDNATWATHTSATGIPSAAGANIWVAAALTGSPRFARLVGSGAGGATTVTVRRTVTKRSVRP